MRILITEDNQVVRRMIRKELEQGGYKVFEAPSGERAIHDYLLNDDIQLITLDVNMDGIDGYETLTKLRNIERQRGLEPVPVIFVTGRDTLEGRFRGFTLGAKDFIVKPFVPGELLSHVDRILKPGSALNGAKILLMDDNKMSREIIRRTLFETGADVYFAQDGEEGYRIIQQVNEKLDMIISDFFMPKMDGIEVTNLVRNQLGLKDIPIIMLTVEQDRERIIDFYKAGVTDYLVKPFLKEELITRIQVHIERNHFTRLIRKNLREKEELIEKSNILIKQLQATNNQLKETRTELVEAEKQNAILATSIAANHEINQPLMVLQGNLDLLKYALEKQDLKSNEKQDNDKKAHFIVRMQGAIKRIEKVLNKMKTVSNAQYVKYAGRDDMVDFKLKDEE